MAWTRVPDAENLRDDEMMPLSVGAEEIAIYRSGGQWFATSNICTHQFALLTDGYLEDGCIECPLHQARFEISSGKAQCAPATEDLRTFPIRVDDTGVFVET